MRRLAASVFIAGAVLMGLEIVGSRILAPVFGTSILVWGALITTFLVSLSAGYALGGRIADWKPRPEVLSDLLALSGALLWIIFLATPAVLSAAERLPVPGRFRPLMAALLLFAPPSVLMGMSTPFAVRLAARDLSTVGTSAGRLSAISTAGSILGTFATAFFLIPAFPLRPILYGLGASLLVAALFLLPVRSARFAAVAALLALGVPAFLVGRRSTASSGPEEAVLLDEETAYHHIKVVDAGRYRSLVFDHLTQGRLPRDPEADPPLTYVDGLFAAFALPRRLPGSIVSIGLGAGVSPRFVERRLPGVSITTIEIDPEVVSVARRFFGFSARPGNSVLLGDGRRVLGSEIPPGGADAILLDAYFSDSIPFHLLTREFFETVRSRLSRDGVFAANFVGSMCGKDDVLFWAAYRTLGSALPRRYVLSPDLRDGRKVFRGNAILIATASSDRLDATEVASRTRSLAEKLKRPEIATWGAWYYDGQAFTSGVPLLTDDYNPTEALQHLRR